MCEIVTREQVLTRIGFAERWLYQARRQCAEGNVTRGLLTLVLADAEVHHALETAGAAEARPWSQRIFPSLAISLAVLATGAMILTNWWTPGPVPLSAEPAPSIVRLTPHVGALLEMVPVTPSVTNLTSTPVPPSVRGAATPVRPNPAALVSGAKASVMMLPSASALEATVSPPAALGSKPVTGANGSQPLVTRPVVGGPETPPALSYVPARPGSLEISSGELIDLVIAADRTLRSEPTRP